MQFLFLSVTAALGYFLPTRVGPTSPGKIAEEASAGLCRPLPYPRACCHEGQVWVCLPLVSKTISSLVLCLYYLIPARFPGGLPERGGT